MISFYKIVQLVQIFCLYLAYALELLYYLCHQLVLLEVSPQPLTITHLSFHPEILAHHLVHLISLVYLPCYFLHTLLSPTPHPIQLAAMFSKPLLIMLGKRDIFFLHALKVELVASDTRAVQRLSQVAVPSCIFDWITGFSNVLELVFVSILKRGFASVVIINPQFSSLLSEGLMLSC